LFAEDFFDFQVKKKGSSEEPPSPWDWGFKEELESKHVIKYNAYFVPNRGGSLPIRFG
jgi:hypothetical protein